jgi:hypothetical protein
MQLALLVAAFAASADAVGSYVTKQENVTHIPGLTAGGLSSAVITYPVGKSGEKFPFVIFGHGSLVGSRYPHPSKKSDVGNVYKTLLHTVASYGFVIVSPRSCPTFCDFTHDMLTTAEACRNDVTLHPALAMADFSGIGVFGHSNGAAAAGELVTDPSNIAKYKIKAAVSNHGGCGGGGMYGPARPHGPVPAVRPCKNAKVPIMFTSGSNDKFAPEAMSVKGYKACSGPKVLFTIAGATHFEPIDGKGAGREDEPTALFLACHLRNEHCPQVSGDAICNQTFKLSTCKVSGTGDEMSMESMVVRGVG